MNKEQVKDYRQKRPHWRRIWQVTSGCIKNITPRHIEETLEENKKSLLDGLLQYTTGLIKSSKSPGSDTSTEERQTPPVEKSTQETQQGIADGSPEKTQEKPQKALPEKRRVRFAEAQEETVSLRKTENFKKIMIRLSDFLKVGKRVTWKVLTSYIMYDYCGTLKMFEKLRFEMHIVPMLSNIWKFYSSERMFKIKVLKTCLEFMNSEHHPYAPIYRRFIYDLGVRNIWESLLKQFQFLMTEITTASFETPNDTPLKSWLERNVREQIEILHCLIILIDYAQITLTDFEEVLLMFKSHGFGKQPCCFESVLLLDAASVEKLNYTEIAVILCMANCFWGEVVTWYDEEEEEDIDEDMTSLLRYDVHAPLIYIWIVMHMVLPNAAELYNAKYYKWTEKVLHTKVFLYFNQLVKLEMFDQTSIVGLNVREALYHLMFITCEKFNQGESLFHHDGILELTSELLKTPQISEKFFEQGSVNATGLMTLWVHTINLFPYDFIPTAMWAEALCTSDKANIKIVMKEIEQLQTYTMKAYQGLGDQTKPPPHVGKVTVVRRLSFTETNFMGTGDMPPDVTTFNHNNEVLVRFSRDNNFWFEFFDILNVALEVGVNLTSRMDRLISGLRLAVTVVNGKDNALEKYPYLKNILKASLNLFVKFVNEAQPPIKLLALCVDLFTGLLRNYRKELVVLMNQHRLLPNIQRYDFEYRELFMGDFITPGLIGHLIINNEKNVDQHLLVTAFLKFIYTDMQLHKGEYAGVELPAVMFIMKSVFPNLLFWYSGEEIIGKDIFYLCINILYEMFQFTNEELEKDRSRNIMHLMTLYFLLDQTGARILLYMLVNCSNNIQFLMETQTNWYYGYSVKTVTSLQVMLALLLQLLELRKKCSNSNSQPFPLEDYIYNENHNLKIIKSIANLLHHPFNTAIPNLACRLLKKFTVELKTSMLASLEMEPDQVRMIFLQRLRDDLETAEIKEAIIDFITVGVSCQSGMTEAFFTAVGSETETECEARRFDLNLNENVGNFMVEYLVKATLDTSCLESPIFLKVMDLFHALWMNQKEMLIKNLLRDRNFWPSLCYPLFKDICFENKLYAQIFNIITKEIHKTGGEVNSQLEKVLVKLFAMEENYVNVWINHIFNTYHLDEELHDVKIYPSLLNAWKNFIVVAVKLLSADFFSAPYKIKITNVCRDSLKNHVMLMRDYNSIMYCAELYLFLMTNWDNLHCYASEALYEDIINLVNKAALSYCNLPKKMQETILAVSVVSFKSLKTIVPDQAIPANILVDSIVQIYNYEYSVLVDLYKNKSLYSFHKHTHKGYFMCFAILNELITAKNSEIKSNYMEWLNESDVFKITLACAGILASHPSTMPLAKDALETLIFYTSLANSANFVTEDVGINLWEKFLPQPELFKPNALDFIQPVPPVIKDWWRVYKRMIMILIILLKKYDFKVIKPVLMFVSLHHDYLKELLLLEIHSVDMYALDLVLIVLNLIYELIKFRLIWVDYHGESFDSLIGTVKMTLQCSAGLLIRPNILKYYKIEHFDLLQAEVLQEVPEENLVEIVNMLTNIVTISTKCLLLLSPPLCSLVTDRNDYSYWDLLINPCFGVPKLGTFDLTFGTLICLSSLFVRILQQKIPKASKDALVASDGKITQGTNTEMLTEGNIQNKEEQSTATEVIFTKPSYIQPTVGFVRIDYLNPWCTLTTCHNLTYSSSLTILPWYTKLNDMSVTIALETVLSLLARQVGPLLKYGDDIQFDRYIRKELCSELALYHEFVKKKLIELYSFTGKERNNFLRKKVRVILTPKKKKHSRRRPRKDSLMKKCPEIVDKSTSTGGETAEKVKKKVSFEEPNDSELSDSDEHLELEVLSINPNFSKETEEDLNKLYRIERRRYTAQDFETAESNVIPDDYFHFLSMWFKYVIKTDIK